MMPYRIVEQLCVGCTACLTPCPVACITGATRQLHWIDPEACISCGACGIVCPTQAILDGAGEPVRFIKRRKQRPIAVVTETLCSGCDYCADVCPFDCLEVPRLPGVPQAVATVSLVAPQACIACRLCEDVCQKDAITVRFPDGTPFVPVDGVYRPTKFVREEHEGPGAVADA